MLMHALNTRLSLFLSMVWLSSRTMASAFSSSRWMILILARFRKSASEVSRTPPHSDQCSTTPRRARVSAPETLKSGSFWICIPLVHRSNSFAQLAIVLTGTTRITLWIGPRPVLASRREGCSITVCKRVRHERDFPSPIEWARMHPPMGRCVAFPSSLSSSAVFFVLAFFASLESSSPALLMSVLLPRSAKAFSNMNRIPSRWCSLRCRSSRSSTTMRGSVDRTNEDGRKPVFLLLDRPTIVWTTTSSSRWASRSVPDAFRRFRFL
mmetsp:Transcript_14455/g.40254  ORF Transcript_14455/g.40254 Transcript_14455/m.40254 type:complete len:267 (-) Transcript_14455:81-881(-)